MAVVLVLVAVANLTAARREHRVQQVASDVTTAVVSVTADPSTLRPGSVVLTVSISNNGPVLQVRAPRVEAAGYTLEPIGPLPGQVARGATVLLRVRLRGACRAEAEVPPRLVARVVPPSGRLHEVTAGISPDLQGLLCGTGSPAAISPGVAEVRSSRNAVTFRLTVRNRLSAQAVLQALAGEGLAFSIRGGFPVRLPGTATTSLFVRLEIPACAQLPEPLDAQRTDTLPFGAFELMLTDNGVPQGLPYLPSPTGPLQTAVRALAHRTCPHAVV